jgi:hypothetical protein
MSATNLARELSTVTDTISRFITSLTFRACVRPSAILRAATSCAEKSAPSRARQIGAGLDAPQQVARRDDVHNGTTVDYGKTTHPMPDHETHRLRYRAFRRRRNNFSRHRIGYFHNLALAEKYVRTLAAICRSVILSTV